MGLSRKRNCEVWWRFMQAHPAPHGGSTSRYGQHAEQGAKGAFERYHEARSYMLNLRPNASDRTSRKGMLLFVTLLMRYMSHVLIS